MSEHELPWWNGRRRAGFRLSVLDAIVLALCSPATWLLWYVLGELALLCPVVLGHFFLFCNVFRVHRNREMIWGVSFVAVVCLLTWLGVYSWWRVCLFQSPVTLGVIMTAILSNNYRGLGWSRKKSARASTLPPSGNEPPMTTERNAY